MRVQANRAFDGVFPEHASRLQVDAASTMALRESLSGPLAWVRSRRVTIDVASWQAPRPGWSGRLGPLPGVLRHEILLPDGSPGSATGPGPGRARVRVVLTDALPFHVIAAAALAALTAVSRLPATVSPDVAAYGGPPSWLPPWANVAGAVGDSPDEEVIRPYDVLLTDAVRSAHPRVSGAVAVLAEPWGVPGKVVVDATVVNPRGYQASHRIDASLEDSPAGLVIRAGVGGFPDVEGPLSPDRIESVRALRSIRVDSLAGPDAAAEALALVQLAMIGVVVHTPAALPGAVAGRLAAELVAIFAEPLPPVAGSDTEWEARSVRQRRAALRNHATAWALPTLAAMPAQACTPSVSLVLAVTRPEPVRSAFAILTAQTYPALELVLALPDSVRSGIARLDELRREAQRPVELVVTDHAPAEAFAVAVGRARGSLITRIEPDARYDRDHIWDLVLAMHYSGAAVVGKACEFFLRGPGAVVRRPAGGSESFTAAMSDGPVLLARSDFTALVGAAEGVTPAGSGWDRVASGPGYRTHPFGFVRPAPAG